VRIHNLHHSFASYAVSAGHSLPMIGKLLGHTQVQTTARYAHLMTDPMHKEEMIFSNNAAKSRQKHCVYENNCISSKKLLNMKPKSQKHTLFFYALCPIYSDDVQSTSLNGEN